MDFPNIFEKQVANEILTRLNKLTNTTKPLWGKMNAAQMLAHLNVAYDLTYEKIPAKKPGLFMGFVLKKVIKPIVVGSKMYKKNSRTAPVFLIADEKDFLKEKQAFINNVNETVLNGIAFFEGKENASFGKLSINEWNNLFYKHIHHHFSQFNI